MSEVSPLTRVGRWQTAEVVTESWLPPGHVRMGLTAGASTPDNLVARVIEAVDVFCNGATA